ncbi:MAG: RAMP superfamily CRISPR-associated protein [Candidatus Asgardarchaeia archaeon]
MKAFLVKLKNESLLQVGSHEISRFMYFSQNFIPSQTLRGALAYAFFQEVCTKSTNKCLGDKCPDKDKCPFFEVFNKPSLFLTPAYPIDETCSFITVPAQFISKCKVCGKVFNMVPYMLSSLFEKRSKILIHTAQFNGESHTCGLTTLKACSSAYYCLGNGTIVDPPRKQSKVSIGINRKRAAAEEGMLYLYEGIRPKQHFSSLIFTLSDVFAEFLKNLDKETIFIGRGKSRGFGVTRVMVSRVNFSIEKRAEEILNAVLFENTIVGIALSHIFNFQINDKGDIITTSIFDINKAIRNAVNTLGINITMKNEFEILDIFGSISYIGGWSLMSMQPRTKIQVALPGSVYVIRAKENITFDDAIGLACLEIVGGSPFINSGFNRLYFANKNLLTNMIIT